MRSIKPNVERLLWGVAAGRCEFEGCNKVLYKHEVTGSSENFAEKAHIYAVSPGGARFSIEAEEFKNDIKNLMLVCPQCHVLIDRDEEKYSPEVLQMMKHNHEKRIYTLSNIGPKLQSYMIYYTANIAGDQIGINDGDARNALASAGRYPTDNSPINLSLSGSYLVEKEDDYYTYNKKNLQKSVKERVLDVITNGSSIALFSIAPQPLLILLGHLLNDKYNVSVFQYHRRETDKWRWNQTVNNVEFKIQIVEESKSISKIALIFSLSCEVSLYRIKAVLGDDISIYIITIDSPNRNFVENPEIMDNFILKSREAIEIIKNRFGKKIDIHVFPCMPNSLAIRFGMDYMPKADNRLVIYDELENKGFVYSLTIGEKDE